MRHAPSLVVSLVGLLALSGSLLAGCGDDDPAPAAPASGGSGGSSAGAAGSGTAGNDVGGSAGVGGGNTAGSGGGITPKPGPENVATTYAGWDWVPVPGSLCRNVTETGIAISKGTGADADKVIYFVEGGNACFNTLSCAITAHPEGFGVPQFKKLADAYEGNGILNRGDAANPFKDWTYVAIPYCSGDVFAGNKADVTIGDETFLFQGFKNMGLFIDAAKAKLPNPKQVVLSGFSAGGFGAAFNVERFAAAYEPMDVTLIDDSGPPMGNEYLKPCLQKKFDAVWNMSSNLPTDCTNCLAADGSFIEAFIGHVLTKRQNLRVGLISSQSDQTISQFWSFGNNDCKDDFPAAYPAGKYGEGLLALRDGVFKKNPNARVYYLAGSQHVWLLPPDKTKTKTLADVKVGDDTLSDWLTGARDGGDKWKNVSAF